MLKKIVNKITAKKDVSLPSEPLRLAFFTEREDVENIIVTDFGNEVWLEQHNKDDTTDNRIMLTNEQMLTLHYFFKRRFEIPPSTREIKE